MAPSSSHDEMFDDGPSRVSITGQRDPSRNTYNKSRADQDDDDDEDGGEGWEDVDDTLDLSLPSTKAQLLSYANNSSSSRQLDQVTYSYLSDFFLRAARENLGEFQNVFGLLSEDEQDVLKELATVQT